MSGARRRALAILLAVLVGAAVTAAVIDRDHGKLGPRPEARRPALLLLTSLPLVFSEQFALKGHGSPALAALETRYRVVPISVADPRELAKSRLLLMAHASAQPAEDLVALDGWVRKGGRVLLLADPMLEWPSSRPLGDPLRPSPMFMDTGLLAHWGLRLDAPDRRGRAERAFGSRQIVTDSPGRLAGRGCAISDDGLVADCRIGAGRAIVVADADFLDAERLGSPANLDALLGELAKLEAQ